MASTIGTIYEPPQDIHSASHEYYIRRLPILYKMVTDATHTYDVGNTRRRHPLQVQVEGIGGGDSVVVKGRLERTMAFVTLGTISADGLATYDGLYQAFQFVVTVATGPTITVIAAVGPQS